MKIEVFYFSGTGNSLFLAKEIAKKLEGSVQAMAAYRQKEKIKLECDILGLVFPIYYADLPNMIVDFTQKLQFPKNCYIFAAATYGGAKGNSSKHLEKLLAEKEQKLSAFYGIHLPQNAFYKFFEKHEALYDKALGTAAIINQNTREKKAAWHVDGILIDILTRPLNLIAEDLTASSFRKKLNLSKGEKSLRELMKLMDQSYGVNEKCNSCGLCAKVCPVANIQMEDEKPQFLHNCENCLACYNFCPQKAISISFVQKDYFYKNPGISVFEMKKQPELI